MDPSCVALTSLRRVDGVDRHPPPLPVMKSSNRQSSPVPIALHLPIEEIPKIKVFSWPTSNVYKVHIMLEECGLRSGRDWEVVWLDIEQGEQFAPEFLRLSPNNKIPVLVDPQGPDGKPIALFESGAILLYLAAKTGKLLPKSDRHKYQVLQWLMFQVAGLGPTLGQNRHFRSVATQKIDYAIARYTAETQRLYGVMDKRLGASKFIACDQYTLADIAIFPALRHAKDQGIDWSQFPRLEEWFDRVSARPAVQRVLRAHNELTATRRGAAV